jgi:hypothetical protein
MREYVRWTIDPERFGYLGGFPDVTFEDSVIKMCYDQIDLNTSDSVLLYSGVLQAVPLLGSVFKFNQIMKNVSRHVSKSLRKKPFTTVLKDLIGLDFIDRFVIAPTLADIRKFQDATDYCLRVIQTARERNEHVFALSATDKTVLKERESTFFSSCPVSGGGELNVSLHQQVYAESKAFMLVEARYDLNAVSPLKLWAQRVGLTRPLDSVWDLVPFSFVVDYFTRAGDFISALSDEMSSVDGLRGKIVAIHDLWYTLKGVNAAEAAFVSWRTRPRLPEGWRWEISPHFSNSPASKKQIMFQRGQISNPWPAILSLERKVSDYLTVSVDLSSTRKRTLAELFIQARLK